MTTKPLIGIGSDVGAHAGERDRSFAYLTYVNAVRQAGAVPVILPPQPENVEVLLERLDGILLAGGNDCDPTAYGEEPHASVEPMDARRQENDLTLARLARSGAVPTLGICLGMQVMNIAAGGTLIQDIASTIDTEVVHEGEPLSRARHGVDITPGSRLAAILGKTSLDVNSSHHQAIGDPGPGLEVTAHAPDGIVEAIEDRNHPFYVGVQWHPEDMSGEASAKQLFEAFIRSAAERAGRRAAAEAGVPIL
jgi:putative glutamine amidotransferase